MDYTPLNLLSVTLPAGTTRGCVNVSIIDDMVPEPALEFFNLILSSNDQDVVIPSPSVPVGIENDDSMFIPIEYNSLNH